MPVKLRIIKKYFKNVYFNKLENLEVIVKFIDAVDLQKLNQENMNHLHRLITSNEIKIVKVSQ
jgi:hypothetical protein